MNLPKFHTSPLAMNRLPQPFRLHPTLALLCVAFGLGLALPGCGGAQSYGGNMQPIGGDLSPGYGGPLSAGRGANGQISVDRGAYPMLETTFQLPGVTGDPFDYEKTNVQVTLKRADGSNIHIPAFFDGGTTWKMRYTPTAPGVYSVVEVKLNNEIVHESKMDKKEWTVNGSPKPGFIRKDRGNNTLFVFDSGQRYYPLGHNVAWQTKGLPDYSEIFGKMHTAGENWTSVWLDQRDGKSLDVTYKDKQPQFGAIDLDQAKKWDSILQSAEKNGIYLQLVVEQSSALASKGTVNSSNVHAEWDKNPINSANGGYLKSPDSFFTDPQARTMLKRKLYYMLARWGYSPNILAFDLFHNVQDSDAGYSKHWDDIAMWHREMAIFMRTYDGYKHLLTTSAAPEVPFESPVWETVDYVQVHAYAPDLLAALPTATIPPGKKLDKPILVTEFGPLAQGDPEGIQLHEGLWAGLISNSSGGAQYWDWDNVEQNKLYDQFHAATSFVTMAGLPEHQGLSPVKLSIDTSQKGALSFGPGSDTGSSGPTEFVVGSSGPPAEIARLSPLLPGKPKNGSAKQISFQVSYLQAGAFSVSVGQVSSAGAHLKVSVDGKATEREFPPAREDHAPDLDKTTLSVDVPAGAHTVTVENDGDDWLSLRRFTLSNYTPALAGLARASRDYAIAWIYNRDGLEANDTSARSVTPATGHVSLPGLQKGKYVATWWDTRTGKSIDSSDLAVTNSKEDISVSSPPITRDVALYIVKAGTKPANKALQNGRGRNAPGLLQPGNQTGLPSVSAPGQNGQFQNNLQGQPNTFNNGQTQPNPIHQ